MNESGYALESPRVSSLARPRAGRRVTMSTALSAFVAGNAALMVWLWVHGGNVSDNLSTGELLTSLARITGLRGAYSALLQVLLLARLQLRMHMRRRRSRWDPRPLPAGRLVWKATRR
jgi:hypothetical protein